jgi:LPXTG-site transpeptidase (sortase) family protein
LIPVTGFAPGRITDLRGLPVTRYSSFSDVSLEIPVLKLKLPIAGIPLKDQTWDVNWLLNQAGWLEGSAFPGFSGNSVLTSHVTLSYGQPGPFANLHKLKTGDKIFVHSFGELYIYEVRSVRELSPVDPSILQHEDKSWLTLVTCADYSEQAQTYLSRLVVKAELVHTQPGYWWSTAP